MANLAFNANFYDIAATVDQWGEAEEVMQQNTFPSGNSEELAQQMEDIVELDMPKRWEAFQENDQQERYVAAAQHLLHMVFDSRRVVMCHSLKYTGTDMYLACRDSRAWLRGAVENAYGDAIDPRTYSESYLSAINAANLGLTVKPPDGIKKLVERTLSLTCTYIYNQLYDEAFFFPAPGSEIGVLEPYHEFEQYRIR